MVINSFNTLSDKIALELYPRIVNRGHSLVAYSRIYPGDNDVLHNQYEGVQIKYFKINIPDGVICRDRIEPEEPFNTLIFLLLIRKSHNANPPKNICIKKNYQ